MKSSASLAHIVVICLLLSGCVSLSRTDRAILDELKSYGINETEVQAKDPGTAAVLNILPGFGNFYLGIGTTEHQQWLFGALNLLAWPISVIWGIPEAAMDAETINKKETVYYYTHDRKGRAELDRRKQEDAERRRLSDERKSVESRKPEETGKQHEAPAVPPALVMPAN